MNIHLILITQSLAFLLSCVSCRPNLLSFPSPKLLASLAHPALFPLASNMQQYLPFLSEVIEHKMFFSQPLSSSENDNIMEKFQSGFGPHHSMDSALPKVCSIYTAVSGLCTTKSTRSYLHLWYNASQCQVGIQGGALHWFAFLCRNQKPFLLVCSFVTCGVPQGSELQYIIHVIHSPTGL